MMLGGFGLDRGTLMRKGGAEVGEGTSPQCRASIVEVLLEQIAVGGLEGSRLQEHLVGHGDLQDEANRDLDP